MARSRRVPARPHALCTHTRAQSQGCSRRNVTLSAALHTRQGSAHTKRHTQGESHPRHLVPPRSRSCVGLAQGYRKDQQLLHTEQDHCFFERRQGPAWAMFGRSDECPIVEKTTTTRRTFGVSCGFVWGFVHMHAAVGSESPRCLKHWQSHWKSPHAIGYAVQPYTLHPPHPRHTLRTDFITVGTLRRPHGHALPKSQDYCRQLIHCIHR